MKLQVFQHVPFEGPGLIADWARSRGHDLAVLRMYEPGGDLPDTADYDALVVMGGPMSVHDEAEHSWLAPEKRHLRAALADGKALLGVCLGAQLLAEALGAPVVANPQREIGWHPLALTDAGAAHPLLSGLNSAMTVFHWHGERFAIPVGAVRLAASEACQTQAFAWGERVLALQFHLEITRAGIEDLIAACAEDLVPGVFVQGSQVMLAQAARYPLQGALDRLLDNWASTWR